MDEYRNYWLALPEAVDPQRIDVAALDAAMRATGIDLDGVGLTEKAEDGTPAAPHVVVAAAGDPSVAFAALDWTTIQTADAP